MTEKRIASWAIGIAVFALLVVGLANEWDAWALIGIAVVAIVAIAAVLGQLRRIGLKATGKGVELTADLGVAVREETRVTGLPGTAGIYAFVHNQLAGNDPQTFAVKVRLQDQLVDLVRKNAFDHPVDDAEVTRILTAGSPAERVLVFGLLQAVPRLTTIDRLEEGILRSQSANEQYHALVAARARLTALSDADRVRLRAAVENAPYLGQDDRDTARESVAAELLGQLSGSPG